jgi:hypothetical protein
MLSLAAFGYLVLLSIATKHQEHRFLLSVTPFLHLPVSYVLYRQLDKQHPAKSKGDRMKRGLKLYIFAAMAVHVLIAAYLLCFHQVLCCT